MSAEPFWIAIKTDWLSIHMTIASCDGNNHSSAMRIATFSSSYDEVMPAVSSETKSPVRGWVVTGAGDDVFCVEGEAEKGLMIDGGAVNADE